MLFLKFHVPLNLMFLYVFLNLSEDACFSGPYTVAY